jgi:hypothetical protein
MNLKQQSNKENKMKAKCAGKEMSCKAVTKAKGMKKEMPKKKKK